MEGPKQSALSTCSPSCPLTIDVGVRMGAHRSTRLTAAIHRRASPHACSCPAMLTRMSLSTVSSIAGNITSARTLQGFAVERGLKLDTLLLKQAYDSAKSREPFPTEVGGAWPFCSRSFVSNRSNSFIAISSSSSSTWLTPFTSSICTLSVSYSNEDQRSTHIVHQH